MAPKTWPHMACSFTTPLESRLSTFASEGMVLRRVIRYVVPFEFTCM